MRIKHFIFLFLVAFISCGLFVSCGKKDTSGNQDSKKEDTTKFSDQQKQENPIKQNKSGSEKPGNELGISEGIPKDYPSDIPQPKNAKPMGYLTTQDGTVVTFESDEKPKDIFDDFSSQIEKNGYKKDEGGSLISDKGGLALWKKDIKECSIMLSRDDNDKKSSIVITYK